MNKLIPATLGLIVVSALAATSINHYQSATASGVYSIAAAPGAAKAKKAAPASGKCNPRAGTGTLTINITPRPGTTISAVITGPRRWSRTITTSQTFRNVPTGTYTARVTANPPRVIEEQEFGNLAYSISVSGGCVDRGKNGTITIGYRLEPGSGKLWVINPDMSNKKIFSVDLSELPQGSEIASSNTITLNLDNTIPIGVAFDPAGNLWVASRGYASYLMRFDRETLGNGGLRKPSLKMSGDWIEDVRDIAFDSAGSLWAVSTYRDRIMKFNTDQLRSGSLTPRVIISNLDMPRGIAFDPAGNLWVGNTVERGDGFIGRFNASRLNTSTSDPPDVIIHSPLVHEYETLREGSAFAFDERGNLWVGYSVARRLVAFSPEQQGISGERIIPIIQIPVSLEGIGSIAFDEAGGLWYSQDLGRRIKRLAPEQLVTPVDPLVWASGLPPETNFTMAELRYGGGIAINVSPSWSPINDKPRP